MVQDGNRLCELTSSDRRRERREAMAAEAEARMEAECTFRPRLHTRQTSGAGQENRDPEARTLPSAYGVSTSPKQTPSLLLRLLHQLQAPDELHVHVPASRYLPLSCILFGQEMHGKHAVEFYFVGQARMMSML